MALAEPTFKTSLGLDASAAPRTYFSSLTAESESWIVLPHHAAGSGTSTVSGTVIPGFPEASTRKRR